MYCPECGSQMNDDWVACPRCGHKWQDAIARSQPEITVEKGGWHPNKSQWWVIWIAVILGLLFGIGAQGGLVGFAVPVLIGALLVWQLQGKGDKI